MWVNSLSQVPALVSKYQPCRPTELLSVTVNPGEEASASEYETTRDSCKSIQHLLQLPSVGAVPGGAAGGARFGVFMRAMAS